MSRFFFRNGALGRHFWEAGSAALGPGTGSPNESSDAHNLSQSGFAEGVVRL